jgi:CheY-like chemotaxis protein
MKARVLVIEDNRANRELMTYLLRAFGHTPLEARDGLQGLEAIRRERPDLVACDIDLPKLDGYSLASQVKADGALRAIPLVAVTALALVGDREHALEAGFDGYISKPIDPMTFVSQLERFLPAGGGPREEA